MFPGATDSSFVARMLEQYGRSGQYDRAGQYDNADQLVKAGPEETSFILQHFQVKYSTMEYSAVKDNRLVQFNK